MTKPHSAKSESANFKKLVLFCFAYMVLMPNQDSSQTTVMNYTALILYARTKISNKAGISLTR